MPIRISCDDCPFETEVKDALAGKRVKCPKCQAAITVPALTEDDEDEPVPPPKTKAKPRVVADDEDDAPRPKAKKRPVVVDEDDEDDHPKPKKRKAAAKRDDEGEGGKSKLWLFVGIGAAVLVLGGIGIYLATRDKKPEVAKPNDPQPGPVIPGPVGPGPINPGPVGPGPVTPGTGGEKPKPETIPEQKPRATIKVTFPEVFAVFLSDDGTKALIKSGGGGKSRSQVWNLTGDPKMDREIVKPVPGVIRGSNRYAAGRADAMGFDILELDSDKVVKPWPKTLRMSLHLSAQSADVVSIAQLFMRDPAGKGDQFIVTEWDMRSGEVRDRITVPHTTDFEFGGFTDGGKTAVVGWKNSGKVQVWDVPSGTKVTEFTLPPIAKNLSFNSLQASADGKWLLVTVSAFGSHRVVDAKTGATVADLPKEFQIVADFVPGRDWVFGHYRRTNFGGGNVKSVTGHAVYDFSAKKLLAVFPNEGLHTAFSMDGKTVATWKGSKRTDVELWDLGELAK